MNTFRAGDITLEQVREHVWEMPQTGEMRVPARVYASEPLLEEIADDMTLQQLQNSAHLPGIVKHAICMPDGHQGYGFPVGGVGAMDAEHGCISPGAVGYDINCLTGDTEVQLAFGRRRKLSDLRKDFEHERAIVTTDETSTAGEIHLFTENVGTVFEVTTKTGDTIRATRDHPFLTPDGMTELAALSTGSRIRINPFRGVPDEPPNEFVVVSEQAFADEHRDIREDLIERGLLPLQSTDDAFHRLLKLLGYYLGNGASVVDAHTRFYADPVDLAEIRADLEALGFTPECISSGEQREYDRVGQTVGGLLVRSKAFGVLLKELAGSTGDVDNFGYSMPWYFDRLVGWQQRLFISAYFGAGMEAPSTRDPYHLDGPHIPHPRGDAQGFHCTAFVRKLAEALAGIGIETNRIESSTSSTAGRERAQLRIGDDSSNLIRFYATIGYTYNRRKQAIANKAIQYLKTHAHAHVERERTRTRSIPIADGGSPDLAPDTHVRSPTRHTEEGVGNLSNGRQGRAPELLTFESFCERTEVEDNLTVTTEIRSIEIVGEAPVYDIGVDHPDHNFTANGFVVSNCGVRMMKTDLEYPDIQGYETELVDALFANIPSGLGAGGVVETNIETIDEILARGVKWAVENGWAVEEDLAYCEDEGSRPEADPAAVSSRAKNRGKNQVGSLGSGNHFLEVQRVSDIFLDDVAETFGLRENQVVVLIHCGSRGLGHQVCTDYLRKIEQAHADLLAELPDKELAAAPAGSELAAKYYDAMGAAINFAWVNRQLVMHRTREVFERVFDRSWQDMGMHLLYDVAHNIAKKETHTVDGEDRELFVHRKGATRSFPAGRPELPPVYADVGQPVIIPGSMGAGSYVLRGGERSLELSFGSTAHGAGRVMSRTQAKKTYWGEDVQHELEEDHHVFVRAQSGATVAEEAPGVYKDVDEVVRVSHELGIGDPVVRTFPVCNIKG